MSFTFQYVEIFWRVVCIFRCPIYLKIIAIDKDDLFRCGSPLIVYIHICRESGQIKRSANAIRILLNKFIHVCHFAKFFGTVTNVNNEKCDLL